MKSITFLIIFGAVFLFLLGLFPIVFYIIWSIHNSMKKKKAQMKGQGKPKHYHLARLKELRENPRIRL